MIGSDDALGVIAPVFLGLLALGCGPEGEDGSSTSFGEGLGTTEVGDGDGDPSGDGDGDPSGDGDGDADPSGDGDGEPTGDGDGEGTKFDVMSPDGGMDDPPDAIPKTCADAAAGVSTVGCEFLAVDLDQIDGGDAYQFAVAVSNVQTSETATVEVEQKINGAWMTVAGPELIPALDLHVFLLDDLHQEESGKRVGGAYRISSDLPIVAYQFNPLNIVPDIASSDATMLYPTAALDYINHVVGWEPHAPQHGTYLTVAAAVDGTVVTITPSAATTAGAGVPAGVPGQPMELSLDAGDVVELMTKVDDATLSGTRVVSDEQHPIALFSGSECTFVLAYSCDHLENQMSGVRLWGTTFVAARMPPRVANMPESSVWQVYASEDGTSVSFEASPAVSGVPANAVLDAGELLTFEAVGPAIEPGDFIVTADKPIAVMNYMTGSSLANSIGDPAMVQVPAVEQFLPRYVVLVPETWDPDFAIITRPTGVAVRIDDVEVDELEFGPVSPDWEVARVPISDGVHVFDGDAPFGVVVAGYTTVNSYAYVGGIGAQIINPDPQG